MDNYYSLGSKTRHLLVSVPIVNILINVIMFILAFFYGTFSIYYTLTETADFQTIQPLVFCIGVVLAGTLSIIISILVLSGSNSGLKTSGVIIFIPFAIYVLLLLTTFVVITLFFTSEFFTDDPLKEYFYILHIIGGVSLVVVILFTLLFTILLRLSISNIELEE
ncbi:hypothetical protein LOD99_5941 [Oopsacas minuta]|uniref:Uncharacterized protein n=1 Tax=Oopsacas minuta TaxID=111878 RepID=A0AAV7JN64_9METZ|nr:hypothetical protein LOD99_5941 [Oopsacas minuta]